MSEVVSLLDLLQDQIGHRFNRADRLQLALTHKSFANEQESQEPKPENEGDNERYEFLGDAVLDLALSEALMRRFPSDPEGALSKKRASLVNEETLARLAVELKLDGLVRLGRGEMKTGGLAKPRILASALEAILGAVFLDSGYDSAQGVIERVFASRMEDLANSSIDFRDDYKTRLQETAQEIHKATPTYQVESENGPDHHKTFEVSVRLEGRMLATGTGRSKKSAEQDAARQALLQITEEKKP